jgi:hypothetical protein
MRILLPVIAYYLCDIGFSAVAVTETKYCSVMNLENDLRVAISKLQPWYKKLRSKSHIHAINPSMKPVYFITSNSLNNNYVAALLLCQLGGGREGSVNVH